MWPPHLNSWQSNSQEDILTWLFHLYLMTFSYSKMVIKPSIFNLVGPSIYYNNFTHLLSSYIST